LRSGCIKTPFGYYVIRMLAFNPASLTVGAKWLKVHLRSGCIKTPFGYYVIRMLAFNPASLTVGAKWLRVHLAQEFTIGTQQISLSS